MIRGVHIQVLMAAGYAVFLAVAALALELLARHSHRRSKQFQVAGFHYHPQLDAWECPTGKRLPRAESDPARRLVVYRAPAHVCNRCHLKSDCTDSDQGREIERRLDSWLDSEIRRFHRGLSLALVFLAALILVTEIFFHKFSSDRDLLWTVLALMILLASRLAKPIFKHSEDVAEKAAGRSL